MNILITEAQIQERVCQLGREIEADYQGKPLTIVAVLTGSLILLADLIRQIHLPLRVALLQASSYKGARVTAGKLIVNETFVPDVAGRDVLLLDDILDTGHTLADPDALDVRAERRQRPDRRAAPQDRPPAGPRSSPTTAALPSPTPSWSDTAWTTTTTTATCPMWPYSTRRLPTPPHCFPAARREARACDPSLSAADRWGRAGTQLPGPRPRRRGGRGHRPDRPAGRPGTGRVEVAVPIHAGRRRRSRRSPRPRAGSR